MLISFSSGLNLGRVRVRECVRVREGVRVRVGVCRVSKAYQYSAAA